MSKIAVIYARYSSDSQTEQSIEGQLHVCTDYAKSKDIIIVDTYIDRAMTGTNDKRPGFQKMIADSAKKEWDYVLVYKLDRFSRNKYETAIHKKTLSDNGVRVISATEYLPDTPEAIIYETMLEGFAEYYSKELSQKINRGLRESRLKGQFCGGGLPYGYRVVDKKILIDEECAKIVNYIFERYSIGKTVPDILGELNERGILYKEKPFTTTHIYKILGNKKYTGIYENHGEIYDKMYPKLLPDDIYNKVQSILKKNKNGRGCADTIYLLKGKIKCGYCGNTISSETGTSKTGKVLHYYKCAGKKRKRAECHLTNIRQEELEKMVLDNIINALSTPERIQEIATKLLDIQDKRFVENAELKALQGEKQKVDLALQNIIAAIERGIMSNTTNQRLHELEEQQIMLERKIIQEQNKTAVKVSCEVIKEYYKKALQQEPQLLINYIVKEIILYNDKMEIICNTPINKGPDESLGLVFYKNESVIAVYNTKNGLIYDKKFNVFILF